MQDLSKAIQHWHLEPTAKCRLACPRCPRTREKGNFKIVDMSPELIRRNFTSQISKDIRSVQLCGTYGDPIYHGSFFSYIEALKECGFNLTINTNGSGKERSWWAELAQRLDNDTVLFSIDGLDDTNHLYRRGAKWESVMDGLRTMVGAGLQVEWKFIFFKHNQHQTEQVREFARKVGAKKIHFVRSHRFGKFYLHEGELDDPLQPDGANLSEHMDEWEVRAGYDTIAPKCMYPDKNSNLIKGFYISADGLFSPCCWSTPSSQLRSLFDSDFYNLNLNTLGDILGSKKFAEDLRLLSDFKTSPEVCRRFCGHKKGAGDPLFGSKSAINWSEVL